MFEQALERQIFSQQSEKTFIDKILAKEDVNAIREIIKKPKLTRSDVLEVLYLLSGTESKLLNYGEWDRYVILKFFVWIREFVKVAELLYDYQEALALKTKLCRCGGYTEIPQGQATPSMARCACEAPEYIFSISTRTRRILDNIEGYIGHNSKFLIDLYLNIGRTSLSIGATGLLELLKNKFEIAYPQQGVTPVEEKKFSIWRR